MICHKGDWMRINARYDKTQQSRDKRELECEKTSQCGLKEFKTARVSFNWSMFNEFNGHFNPPYLVDTFIFC